MLFGRSGAVNALLEWALGIGPSRWIYGLPGVWLAQTLALTPVAYLVLVGVVDGISPSLEEGRADLARLAVDDVHHGHAAAARPGSSTRS
jgi:iron(III) transport system permease protein